MYGFKFLLTKKTPMFLSDFRLDKCREKSLHAKSKSVAMIDVELYECTIWFVDG